MIHRSSSRGQSKRNKRFNKPLPKERTNREPEEANEKKEPFSSRSMDRLLRLFLALRQNSKGKRAGSHATKPKGKAIDSAQRMEGVDDLVYAHVVSASRFGDDSPEHARRTVRKLAAYPALKQLKPGARNAAQVCIFQAHMADRLKTSGKYWILEGLGPQYPFPLGIPCRS